ncbi:hypothetical protein NST38_30640 [Paenibacillus sp. FSL H8-0104]|uniref:hypothetical protein n=1 Tax=Paenibacillus sp. FSL H8-0104 TaxID=2954509 RepID=UPI0030FDE436
MSDLNKEKAPIVVQITPDMANWMHPQNNACKQHRLLAEKQLNNVIVNKERSANLRYKPKCGESRR